MSVHGQFEHPLRRTLLGNVRHSRIPILEGESPSHWAVYEGAFDVRLVEAAAQSFPSHEWSGWVRYDSPGEKKLAATADLPPACLSLLDCMNDLCPEHLRHDPHFHAAGLNAMPPGGWLDLHLDAECHPTTGYRRATNLILFLDEWKPEFGGALELWGRDRCEVSIMPAAGRAVAFDCRDVVHGIPSPINPFAPWRRSLAIFWYDPTPERRRAQFLEMPGEPENTEKTRWRIERSGNHQ